MIEPIYGTEVLVNAALWISEHLPPKERRIHKLFKILWFADLYHLKKYGRAVSGDTYVAMDYGPVPSALYDIVKGNCSPEYRMFTKYDKGFFDSSAKCNEDYLSETDIEALNFSLDDNKGLAFDALVDKSHAHAWRSAWNAGENTSIRMDEVLDEIVADDALRDYVKNGQDARKALSAKCE